MFIYFYIEKQPEDPDYSCAYVTIYTTNNYIGYGLVTTNGKGNEVGKYILYIKCDYILIEF